MAEVPNPTPYVTRLN